MPVVPAVASTGFAFTTVWAWLEFAHMVEATKTAADNTGLNIVIL